MTTEEKKKYLRGYLAAKRRERLLSEQIEELRAAQTSPRGLGDGMPRGSAVSDLSGYAARWDQLQTKLEAARLEAVEIYNEIWGAITKCGEPDAEILTRRYLLGQSWERIAVEMGYTYRHITRMHGVALHRFDSMRPEKDVL